MQLQGSHITRSTIVERSVREHTTNTLGGLVTETRNNGFEYHVSEKGLFSFCLRRIWLFEVINPIFDFPMSQSQD
jgi:hypothetical protein